MMPAHQVGFTRQTSRRYSKSRFTSANSAMSATMNMVVTTSSGRLPPASDQPIVVGHSAACTLAWPATEARPHKPRVALIGGFPSADGESYADFFEVRDRAMAAIPVREGVTKGVVRLADDRRFDVPAVLVCPEFPPAQAQEWIGAGDVPELAKAKHVDFVDIDSGHWPMVSQPIELARLLATAAAGD